MRHLTKIKLINWHFFTNETIPVDGDTLITGDNGAGKSTLIDAIQVVIIGNLKKVRFNSSAMEDRTTRDIRTYLRGKTGVEGKTNYLRNEDFSSYIVLEITRTTTNTPYLIGVAFDYYHTTGEEEHVFFRIDEEHLHDELFFKSPQELRNRGEFFDYLKARDVKFQQYRNDLNRYIYDLRQLFGGAKESFFSLFTKGISFSPITELRSFVYDYILEEHHLDVENMQEYFEKFRQVEQMIEDTKNEIAALEKIETCYSDIEKLHDTLKINDYMVSRGAYEVKLNESREKTQEKNKFLDRKEELQKQIDEARVNKEQIKETLRNLEVLMGENEAKRKEEELDRHLQQLREKLEEREILEENLVHHFKAEAKEFEQLLDILRNLNAPLEITGVLLEAKEAWSQAAESGGVIFPEKTAVYTEAWAEAISWLLLQKYQWQKEKEDLRQEEARLEKMIGDLENNQVLGKESPTMKLKGVLEENLAEAGGQAVPVHIFCEAIDIDNERWRNAIEGYLHTQKFDLLVPPAFFDEALSLYENHKYTLHIERVGLVNTGKLLQEKREPDQNSLAEEISASIDYVSAYANRLLGSVIKCDSERELKKFRRSITDSCMLYQNHTARQIPRSRYETPYIGKEAIRTQLLTTRRLLEEAGRQRVKIEGNLQASAPADSFSTDKSDRYKYWSEEIGKLQEKEKLSAALEKAQKELLSLDFSEYERLEGEYAQKLQERDRLDEQLQDLNKDLGGVEYKIQYINQQLENLARQEKEAQQLLTRFEEQLNEDILEQCRHKWKNEAQERKPEVLYQNYSKNREGINTKINNQRNKLIKMRTEYVYSYNFPGDPESQDNRAFNQRYRTLIDSHLQDYEKQAREAREKAEHSFQEHFIARLGEYIKLAREEIKELNRALQGMRFGTEEYRFSLMAKAETKHFYDMIMDSGVYEGSIFRPAFYEKYGHAINDLFNEIANRDSELQETMHALTDYRTYLDFDIIITDQMGNKSSFSKVARDKSGGETQVPFYVAILASFYQVYQLYRQSDKLRLVVFDEAFNRMDADRIEEAIRFMQKLGFQAMIVAPTGRIQLIVPYMNTNLVVMKENFSSFIEKVTRRELIEAEQKAEVQEAKER